MLSLQCLAAVGFLTSVSEGTGAIPVVPAGNVQVPAPPPARAPPPDAFQTDLGVSTAWQGVQPSQGPRSDSGWPTGDAVESQSMWPTGQQPTMFLKWPTRPGTQEPLACTTVHIQSLASFTDDPPWRGQCNDLDKVEGIDSVADCDRRCSQTPMCSVWQYNEDPTRSPHMQGCWLGHGRECFDRGRDPELVIQGAERLIQGRIQVLVAQLTHGWLQGLPREVFSQESIDAYQAHQGPAGEHDTADRCREQCYSDIYCTAWQYGGDDIGCFHESREHPLPYPLSGEHVIDYRQIVDADNPQGNANPVAGEFIQHYCPPPEGTSTAAPPAPEHHEPCSWCWIVYPILTGLIIGALAFISFVIYYYYCNKEPPKPKKRAINKVVSPVVTETFPEPEVTPLLFAATPPLVAMAPQPLQYVVEPQPVTTVMVEQVPQPMQYVVERPATTLVQQPQQMQYVVERPATTLVQQQVTRPVFAPV